MTGERGEMLLLSIHTLVSPKILKINDIYITLSKFLWNSFSVNLFFLSKCQKGDKGKGVNNKLRLMSVNRGVKR